MTANKATRKVKPKSLPSQISSVAPAESSADASFAIVGIGASAGGLAAFEAFFSGMPADTDPGMAFVLVQHLAPDHDSLLTELIRRYTRMPVFEIEDGMRVQPNCVYIIPPNRDMALLNGTLQLLEPAAPHGHRLPIDFFFRQLAQDQRERAICIVLSGTGSDGTNGVRAIKGEGGMVMAQNPDSAEFDGMPRSAIATGLVDYELPPAKMAAQLIAYAAHALGKHTRLYTSPIPVTGNALDKILILLRAHTSHDFSQYKPSTVYRRIERRMAVHQIEAIDGYVKYLQQTPLEVEALFRDLLIGVTSFFRDPEAFGVLEERVIPQLFDGKPDGALIRVWSAGCSTGEEAYSIAILLQERMEALKLRYTVQIFATDIDTRAIATARAGCYPASIAADLSPERLTRFFTALPDGRGYQIHKGIRSMLVFSEQDVIKDPPFSKLDLISCRNLLIYMNEGLQRKLIPLFHYALNPGGMLFVGTSEGVNGTDDLFAVLDLKSKLYQRKEDIHGRQRTALGRLLSPIKAMASPPATPTFPVKLPLRELTERTLLQQIISAGALINARGDILYLHGRTGMYLELPSGEAGINNILKMAREGLRLDLATSLRKAVSTHQVVKSYGLHVKTNDHYTVVNLTVLPVTADLAVPLYLVILEEAPEQQTFLPVSTNALEFAADADPRIATLMLELRAKEEYLQTANEELETSNAKLKSWNEEMQAMNEELQSSNEELETSSEELHSVNEELVVVNAELQTRMADLARVNNDMNNLLAGTGVGTVFVDHQLRIMRFTPEASTIINLIPGDVGRPVAHIVSNLAGYDNLVADVQAVLDTLVPKEVDVQTKNGMWYTMRILPYRTLDNVIEGAVITFVDVTEMVRVREALQKANEVLRLAVVVRDAFDAITVQDLDGRILAWNPGAVRMYGWSEAEALRMNVRDLIPKRMREKALARVHQLSLAEILKPYRTKRITKEGVVVEVWLTATALLNEAGKMYAIATTERAHAQVASPQKKA